MAEKSMSYAALTAAGTEKYMFSAHQHIELHYSILIVPQLPIDGKQIFPTSISVKKRIAFFFHRGIMITVHKRRCAL